MSYADGLKKCPGCGRLIPVPTMCCPHCGRAIVEVVVPEHGPILLPLVLMTLVVLAAVVATLIL
jgi:hypothetical protein